MCVYDYTHVITNDFELFSLPYIVGMALLTVNFCSLFYNVGRKKANTFIHNGGYQKSISGNMGIFF